MTLVNVLLTFTDGKKISVTCPEIEEGMTRLVLYEDSDNYSVVPLTNIKFYDVSPSE